MPSPLHFIRSHLLTISLIVALCFGWSNRDDNYLSAETGTGYYLGIIGASLMFILLLYPLSKRVKLLTQWVPIRYWFGIHMLFGVIGPVLILFHSNFHLGSMNSNIALLSMLLVAGSGLVGRYIYTHIHHGLYGSKISLKELDQETENNHREILEMYEMDDSLNQRLTDMEEKVVQPHTGLALSLFHVMYLAVNSRKLKKQVIRLVRESYQNNGTHEVMPDEKSTLQSISRYTGALRRTATFKLYERLFSLWHILHLPLFIMMIITAIIHIFAVHLY